MGSDERFLQLICHSRGFPWPHFEWLEADTIVESAHGRALVVPRFLFMLQLYGSLNSNSFYSNTYAGWKYLFVARVTVLLAKTTVC